MSTKATTFRNDISSLNNTKINSLPLQASHSLNLINGLSRDSARRGLVKCATVGTKVAWSGGRKQQTIKKIKQMQTLDSKNDSEAGKKTVKPVMLNSLASKDKMGSYTRKLKTINPGTHALE